MTAQFVHLKLHSEYSLKDGLVRVKPLLAACKERGFRAVAITDSLNLFAVVKFYQAALSAGIKPIIGADIVIANQNPDEPPLPLTLLCQSKRGYANLISLVSKSYTEGQQSGPPRVEKAWLEQHSEDLIALSAGLSGEIGQALLHDNLERANQAALYYQKLFPNRFYLEVQRTGRNEEESYLAKVMVLAEQLNLPLVAGNEVRFLDADDYDAHEARVCIYNGEVLADPKRPKRYSQEQYFKSEQQMVALFADIPAALHNSVEIAKRCNLTLELGKPCLPNFETADGSDEESYLAKLAEHGLENRLAVISVKKPLSEQEKTAYQQRLEVELQVINRMGYPGYFLIVADFIKWAKQNGVPVGPGRGSGAGSLVAFVLGITDIDPLPFGLLFERFLNPERVSMPDFDVDFCMEGRDRVIDYVADKYGRQSVSQIITYGTMAAKAVVRDVGRVLGHPYGFVDKLAKLIPFELGITLDKALQQEPQLAERYQLEPEVKHLINLARKLEGITRNAGKHAGGVVIAPSVLTDFTALYCENHTASRVTQFDKDDVESVGLVKFDFLGLRTLTIIQWALDSINAEKKQQQQPLVDINLIPTDDVATFDLLKACQTTAVFQLESRGMKELIQRLQPDCFEDIIALVALFRPGPLQSGMVDDFIDRKHGRAEVAYPHPDLEPILSTTYGVILYQEQVMQIAQVLANYTLGAADLLRRAMGKKKPEEMAKQRDIFLTGASERGVDKKLANTIFDLMEKFAGYGFNKSHSAAYALVSYQTAWLKAHYPANFMAAVLSSDMDNTDKVALFAAECRSMQLNLTAPHVNSSFYRFVAEGNNIHYGLGAIKGVGESAIESIIEAREQGGPFQDVFNFAERVDLRKVNRRVFEALIAAGAFDGLGPHRASIKASLDAIIKRAEKTHADKNSGQVNFFAELDNTQQEHQPSQYCKVSPWGEKQRLLAEYQALGFYLSGHPTDSLNEEWQAIVSTAISQVEPDYEGKLLVLGLCFAVKKITTRSGKPMAIVTLQDRHASIEATLFADAFEQHQALLQKGEVLLVEAEASLDEYTQKARLKIERLWSMEQARLNFAKQLVIYLNSEQSNTQIEQLANLLQRFQPGRCPVTLYYQHQGAAASINLEQQWQIRPESALIDQLQQMLGEGFVRLRY